jgi:hypothetical protein
MYAFSRSESLEVFGSGYDGESGRMELGSVDMLPLEIKKTLRPDEWNKPEENEEKWEKLINGT